MNNAPLSHAPLTTDDERSDLINQNLNRVFHALRLGNDRVFSAVLLVEWTILMAIAFFVSPRTWIGTDSAVHMHVWSAVFLGGLICLPAAAIGWLKRGTTIARFTMTIAQTLVVGLMIHFGGGRIEWHFAVFVTLAVLAIYRDPWLLIAATVVVAADHALRGMFWPQSIYGYVGASRLLWMEHAVWVVIEVGFLTLGIRRSQKEMRQIAEREADLALVGQVGIARSVDGMIRDIRNIETTGDLTGRVDARFDGVTQDLAHAINGFIDTLRGIIEDVRTAAQAAATSSQSISGNAGEMAHTADQMLSEAEQIAAAAGEASEVAKEGGEVIGSTIGSLERIGENVQASGEMVGQLDGKSQRISDLVSVIQDIADQTNLLALNAAIESARAGEHGRGFAVVADEVRKLADRTAGVTDEILQAIGEIKRETKQAHDHMQRNSDEANRCMEQSVTAVEMLEQIVERSASLTGKVQSLATGFRGVGGRAEEMRGSVDQMVERNDHLNHLAAKFKTA